MIATMDFGRKLRIFCFCFFFGLNQCLLSLNPLKPWVLCETKDHLLLSARTAMWSMPVVWTEMENENDSANQNYVAKKTLQK